MNERDRVGPCVYLSVDEHLYYVSRPVRRPSYLVAARTVPALADLDWRDPRLLPDGSRVVDALALGIVGRHVAGLEVNRG